MKDYLQTFLPDLPEFGEKIKSFDAGELTVNDYKKFSGGYGSYAQKGAKSHMLRLRLSGGVIDKKKLRAIADMVDKYHVSMAKLTTCESVQLHNLPASDVESLMREAWEAGMITRGGGGDFPRNVMSSPLSGLQRGEYFDVLPYAEVAANYLLSYIKGDKFPRKLKVCFSNSPENAPHATFRDLGFVARADGKFDVYAAGGLGNNPSLGLKVAEEVDPSEILYYIRGMVLTFLEHGNYENRGKARTRFMKEKLGEEGFKQAFLANVAAAREQDLSFTVTPRTVKKKGDGSAVTHWRAIPQKQEGLYSVYYHPVTGQIPPEMFGKIADAIEDIDEAEVRLCPESALYIVNLTGKEAEKLLQVTEGGAETLFETSTCCVGVNTCQGGVGASPDLIRACVEAVRKENFANGVLPRICVSGCPSSCAAHQVADIGFRGAMKPTPNGPKPAFAIFVGGCAAQGKEVIAQAGKSILVSEIPNFFVELGKIVSASGKTYAEWIGDNRSVLDELIEKYTA